jgi:hypothetical protein
MWSAKSSYISRTRSGAGARALHEDAGHGEDRLARLLARERVPPRGDPLDDIGGFRFGSPRSSAPGARADGAPHATLDGRGWASATSDGTASATRDGGQVAAGHVDLLVGEDTGVGVAAEDPILGPQEVGIRLG